MKKVLVLGAGLVSRPHVQYLLAVPEFEVTVASRTVAKAEALIEGNPQGRALALNVKDEAALDALIGESDLAVSMLPYVYHPLVARLCVKHGKHMVTTSYVKQAMLDLDEDAKAAGVVLINEIGVDPGIDHMSAMKVIHEVQNKGGEIVSFLSWTGGLPAPEANDNPWGYKFSWSPRGVMLAGKNPARFRRDGTVVDIPGEELFEHFWPVEIPGFGELEGYPNRDSMPYQEAYGIQPKEWMFRGTLRYPGWCPTMKRMVEMGYVDETPWTEPPATFGELTARLLDVDADTDLPSYLAAQWAMCEDSKPITDMAWLGLFSDLPLPEGAESPIDALAAHMEAKMAYQPGERDLIVMQHEFIAQYPDRRESITATMIDYGLPNGDTSMSRTVGLPAAIAARMVLHGEFGGLTGVHTPVIPEIYQPVLAELADLGIYLTEKVEVL